MNFLAAIIFSGLVSALVSAAGAAESLKADHIAVRFVVPEKLSADTETLVGLSFKPDEHWHVYWKNPGDSGAAPKFAFETKNAKVGSIQWPTPVRLPVAHLTNLGYEGEVLYLFSVKPESSGKVSVSADLEWLVCQEECIPGFGKLEFTRDTTSGESEWKPQERSLVESFAKRLPSSSETAGFRLSILPSTSEVRVSVEGDAPKNVNLYPVDGEFVSPAEPRRDGTSFVFKTNAGAAAPKTFGFVVTSDEGSWEFSNVAPSAAATSNEPMAPLWVLLLSAIAGGFLLNLMPCVFPVISIKAFSLLKEDGANRTKDCLLYSAGVLTTFSLIAVAFLALRQAGASVGWGFQLQSPLVIYALILLFWAMALNFAGVFEFGTGVMNVAGRQKFLNSSFGTGVLSVFVAAPCTGPFMGTALGAAAVAPAFIAFAIIFGLGLGLALPFLVFALFPRTLRWLPRPGAWMETVKHFFAFPLFATVIWLAWVLGLQVGSEGWLFASIAVFGISFALWVSQTKWPAKIVVAWIVAVSAILYAGQKIRSAETVGATPSKSSAWKAFDEKVLAEHLAKGDSVFVDFTAAWCITCQVNKQAVLDTASGQEAFAKQNVVLMRADWTRYDKTITTALAKLGRNSVPVYAYYHRGNSTPRLLPQLLTSSMIENLNEPADGGK